jgi:hypothetical protein
MNKNFTFKIGACYSGDIIYLLSGIKHVCQKQGVKAEIYIWLDHQVKAYDGAAHPYNGVGINRYAFDMLRPLVEAQSYVAKFEIWTGQQIAVDLDELRTKTIAPMPYGSILRWAGYAWPDMQIGVVNPWINIIIESKWEGEDLYNDPDKVINTCLLPVDGRLKVSQGMICTAVKKLCKGKIIINRTSRYRNDMIHYWFLRDYAEDLIFAGLPEEHAVFCKEWEIDIPLLEVRNFLELAVALKSCRYFIGNQSMCFALAEAMQIPRLLEVCPYAPNVITCTHGYDFMHQFALEWFVKNEESPLNELR